MLFDDIKSMIRKVTSEGPQDPGSSELTAGVRDYASKKCTTISIANQKGGVGKTTTCINLASGLAKRNFQVLIIDLDPQSHASLGIDVDVYNFSTSIYDVFVKRVDLEDVIVPTYLKNLEIAPATSLLTGAQLEISDLLGREGILKTSIWRMLNTHAKHYDYILIDSSPSLNLLTINGLVASQSVLIPMQPHYFSLEGMSQLFSTLKIVKERINSDLEILGILPTIFDPRTKMSRDMLAQLKDYFEEKLLKTVIRMNTKLVEAPAHGKSIFDYDAHCNGAKDYWDLTEEIIGLTKPQFSMKTNHATVVQNGETTNLEAPE